MRAEFRRQRDQHPETQSETARETQTSIPYKDTSLIRNNAPLGSYSRTMHYAPPGHVQAPHPRHRRCSMPLTALETTLGQMAPLKSGQSLGMPPESSGMLRGHPLLEGAICQGGSYALHPDMQGRGILATDGTTPRTRRSPS